MPTENKVMLFQTSLGKGGATRSNLKIIELLQTRGVDVALVTGCRQQYDEHMNLKKNKHFELGFSTRAGAVIPLIKFFKESKPDIVIGGMLQCNVVLIAAKIIGGLSFKTILIDRVNPRQEIMGHKGFVYRVLPYLLRLLYPLADALVSVSNGTKEDVISLVPKLDNVRVIYNPAVTKEKLSLSYQGISHPWVNADIPLIVSVGRLVKQKDFATLIKSIKLVVEKVPVKLLILGDGEEKESLLGLIKELKLDNNVSLLGHVSNPHPYLRNCDLFVLSSAWEGFGNVLVEAMSYGTPVVSTDCPSGPSEILNRGEFGRLVPVGDCNRLSEAIIETLDNPLDPGRLIHQASKFNEENSLEGYVKLVEWLSTGQIRMAGN
jgi:glycosyltransferase involved in cell wall biosynthesis